VRDESNNQSRLYLDGLLVNTKNFLIGNPISKFGESDDFTVGAQFSTTERFAGNIDQIKIWDRALDADEICENMTSSLPTSVPDLVAWYDFESGYDQSTILGTGPGSSPLIAGIQTILPAFIPSIEISGEWNYPNFNGMTNPYDPDGQYQLFAIPFTIDWSSTDLNIGSICTANLNVTVPFECQASFVAETPTSENLPKAKSIKELYTETSLGNEINLESNKEIFIVPNPVSKNLVVSISGLDHDTQLSIFDLTGKAVIRYH